MAQGQSGVLMSWTLGRKPAWAGFVVETEDVSLQNCGRKLCQSLPTDWIVPWPIPTLALLKEVLEAWHKTTDMPAEETSEACCLLWLAYRGSTSAFV